MMGLGQRTSVVVKACDFYETNIDGAETPEILWKLPSSKHSNQSPQELPLGAFKSPSPSQKLKHLPHQIK